MSVRLIDLDSASLDELAELFSYMSRPEIIAALEEAMQPMTPERAVALKRCRSLKRLRDDAAATEGERTNAQAAMDRIMAKHGIAAGEL